MRIDTDYLVIGSGIAGLFFALKAAQHGRVALITKRAWRDSNSNHAQGGIAVVTAPEDSVESHVRDTLEAGAGLCKPEVVEAAVREGPEAVRELIEIGTVFSRERSGELALGREGGHSLPRVVHADDLTGQEVCRALISAVRALPQIDLFEHHTALDLLVEGGRCFGVRTLEADRAEGVDFYAASTLLATGGAGQIYLHTSNPEVACGDGMAMAYRAGARIGNAEFVQFHPTTFYRPGTPSFLISEAVRGYGGVLVDADGEPFVERYHRLGSLATRDIVSRAIVDQMRRDGGECVYLDVTGKDAAETRRHFPNIHAYCLGMGIDMTRQLIPVVPAAHYMCGGVMTDLDGATDLDGLYAAGEVACTGLHGANRLASNSLLEGLVFAQRALARAESAKKRKVLPSKVPPLQIGATTSGDEVESRLMRVRRTLWEEVGIVRRDAGLARACAVLGEEAAALEELFRLRGADAQLAQARNVATVAELVAQSARMRRESRGGHFNADHPERNDEAWAHDTVIRMA
jgi:L-aspartate oxidase